MKRRKKDFVIFIIILGAALLSLGINQIFFQEEGEAFGEIYVEGELIETVGLTADRQFSIKEKPNIIFEVKNHAIAFLESDCPDKVCIRSGYLGHTGQSASCLPNKTTIRIRSGTIDTEEPDVVVRLPILNIAAGGTYEK